MFTCDPNPHQRPLPAPAIRDPRHLDILNLECLWNKDTV